MCGTNPSHETLKPEHPVNTPALHVRPSLSVISDVFLSFFHLLEHPLIFLSFACKSLHALFMSSGLDFCVIFLSFPSKPLHFPALSIAFHFLFFWLPGPFVALLLLFTLLVMSLKVLHFPLVSTFLEVFFIFLSFP